MVRVSAGRARAGRLLGRRRAVGGHGVTAAHRGGLAPGGHCGEPTPDRAGRAEPAGDVRPGLAGDSDGVRLSGLLLGSGPDGILLSHEQGYSVCSFLDLGERLAAEGYQVLLPEYRNHGASEKVADNEHLGRDAQAGLVELRRRGATRIFVGGASCGGTASIMVGQKIPDLVGLLIMSSPARCGLMDAVPAVSQITAPSLFVVSPGDMLGAVEEQVRELYARSGSPSKKLVIDDSGYHGTDMFRESDHGERLEARVFRFVLGTFG